MKPASSRLRLTYDDFVLFPDDGQRHELIDGEHYVTPSPNTKHQQVSLNLILAIGKRLEEHSTGRLFHAPFDVVFSNFDVVEPDLLYFSHERASEILTTKHVWPMGNASHPRMKLCCSHSSSAWNDFG